MPTDSAETDDQWWVREHVVEDWLPAWCASSKRPKPLQAINFVAPDWSFLTPTLAYWFRLAIEDGTVEVTDNCEFLRGRSKSEGIFEHHGSKDLSPRPMKLRVESFYEIAAVGMLARRYHWDKSCLRFQPPDWSLDVLAHVDPEWRDDNVAVACEAKRFQKDCTALRASLEICGARGFHGEPCTEQGHHKKYVGLMKYRPGILWIAGPDAFEMAEPDLVLRLQYGNGGVVSAYRTNACELDALSR